MIEGRHCLLRSCLLIVILLPLSSAIGQEQEEREASVSRPWVTFSSGRSGNGDIYALQPGNDIAFVSGTSAAEGAVRYDAARNRVVHHRYEQEAAMLVSNGEDLFVDPNGDVAPHWSHDGRFIVYADQRDGQDDLFLARPDGTAEQRLTNDAAIERYPAWSPDSSRIVFARRSNAGWDLYTRYVVNAEQAPEEQRVTSQGVYVGHPTWSPDGRYIAYDTIIEGDAEIMMIEVSSGKSTRLTKRVGNDLIPAWSPDGKQLVFGGETDGNWDVWMVDVDTLDLQRLTTDPSHDGGPVFVPGSAIGK